MADEKDNKRREKIAATVCDEFREMSTNRGAFDSHCEEAARLVMPSFSGSFRAFSFVTPGEKRTQDQFDSTAMHANTKFASVMESMLTPRNQKWQRCVPSDSVLMKDRDTRLWFEDLTNLLFKYRQAPKANFQAQNHINYVSLGLIGNGCVFVDALKSRGLRYKMIHIGEIHFAENHQGIIDKAIRRFDFTARQAYQKWDDAVSPKVKENAEKHPEKKYWFLHCVKPNADLDLNREDYRGMEFASYYVEEEAKHLLEEGGFGTFPYAISRYIQAPGEVYGRGPAMECLPAIKTLNEQKKTLLKQGHRVVDPVLLAADDGVIDSFSLKSGAINYGSMTADGKRLVDVLPTGNLVAGEKMMELEVRAINDAFLISLFQILVESPQMTATEVIERTREKGMLLSPTMGRQQSEYLGPLIEREIDVLRRQRLLSDMPPALIEAAGEYTIEYDSPLSRAQKAEEVAGLFRSLELPLRIAEVTQDVSTLDHYDFDVIIPEASRIQAVPERWMASMQKVQALREQRAEQRKIATAIEAAPAAAGMVKAMQPGRK